MKAWEGCAPCSMKPGVAVPVDAMPEVDVPDAVEPWSSDEATDGSGVGAEVVVAEVEAELPMEAEPEVDFPEVVEPRSSDGPPTDAPEVGCATRARDDGGEVEPQAATQVVQADAEVPVDAVPDANADVVEQ